MDGSTHSGLNGFRLAAKPPSASLAPGGRSMQTRPMRLPCFVHVTVILIGVLLALAGVARAAEPLAVLPYRIDYGGWFTVSGTIKGKGPFDFIVDTGSTRTLIFVGTVDQIGGVYATNDEPISVIGLSATQKFPTYHVGDIVVGGQLIPDLVTVVLNDWAVSGRSPHAVLGLDFLERFHVEFDAANKVMRLYGRETAYEPPSMKWRSAPILRKNFGLEEGFLFTTDVRLNAAKVEFLIDLGATGTIVNRHAAKLGRNLGVTIDAINTNATRITDALDQKDRARAIYFDQLSIGRTRWRRAVLVVYDAPVFAELGVAGRPFGLIGANFFEDRSFGFDFATRRIFFGPKVKS